MAKRREQDGAGSRERLLRAAAEEFAARGFDGAKVDRITRRARVNKAMLYYHFANKADVYREILRAMFRRLATEVTAVRDAGGAPDEQLRRFIRTIAGVITVEPQFPSIWLREMAEGGRHLDESVAAALREILGVLIAILGEGQAAGVFAPAPPLVTQIGIVAPLLLFAVSEPARERFGALAPLAVVQIPREAIIAHVERATLAAVSAKTSSVRPARRSRS
jgi:AcrR family transcriptional regulator